MAWPNNPRPAKSLVKLREQINAMAPKRSKASDGMIGDAAHASRASDHNPWVKDSIGRGVVTALDITQDLANGVDAHKISRAIQNDPRVKYIIFNGQIYRSYKPQLGWAKYTGSNPHRTHVHVSVLANKMDQKDPWSIDGAVSVPTPVESESKPLIRRGDKGIAVELLQCRLRIDIDGQFGPATEKAVREFQQSMGLTVDGLFGPNSWRALEQGR